MPKSEVVEQVPQLFNHGRDRFFKICDLAIWICSRQERAPRRGWLLIDAFDNVGDLDQAAPDRRGANSFDGFGRRSQLRPGVPGASFGTKIVEPGTALEIDQEDIGPLDID